MRNIHSVLCSQCPVNGLMGIFVNRRMEGHSELCLQSLYINVLDKMKDMIALAYVIKEAVRAAVVHLNFRGGSAFPVPVCTVPSSMDT